MTRARRTSDVRQKHVAGEPHCGHPWSKHSNLEFMCISCGYKFPYYTCCRDISAVALLSRPNTCDRYVLLPITIQLSPSANNEVIWDGGGIALRTLNLSTKFVPVVTFTSRSLYHLKNTPVTRAVVEVKEKIQTSCPYGTLN